MPRSRQEPPERTTVLYCFNYLTIVYLNSSPCFALALEDTFSGRPSLFQFSFLHPISGLLELLLKLGKTDGDDLLGFLIRLVSFWLSGQICCDPCGFKYNSGAARPQIFAGVTFECWDMTGDAPTSLHVNISDLLRGSKWRLRTTSNKASSSSVSS